MTFGVKVTRDDRPGGHVAFALYAGAEHARGLAGQLKMRPDEFEAFIARLKPDIPLQFACICDPDDVFEPPDPKPRVVDGCPSHRARRAYQRYVDEHREVPDAG